MTFTLPRFLRRVPAESLKTYFDERGLDQKNTIGWDVERPELMQRIRTVIEGLVEHDRQRVFDDFERVSQRWGLAAPG